MKEIPGYEGLYAITEDGRVWSYPKTWISGLGRACGHSGKWIAQHAHTGGYRQVVLTKDKQSRMRYVHRLVAAAYIPNPSQLPEVNHQDADKINNHYTNLEWATRKQNSDHAKRLGLFKHEPARGERHPDAKLTEQDVLEIREMWDLGLPLTALEAIYGLSKSATYSVCTHKTWTHI